MSSNSVCNHICDKQIGFPLRIRPILFYRCSQKISVRQCIKMAGLARQRRSRYIQFVFSCFRLQTCCHLGKRHQNYSQTVWSLDGNIANLRLNIGVWMTVWVEQVAIRANKLLSHSRRFQMSFEEQFANRNSYCSLLWLTYTIIVLRRLRKVRI